MIKLVFDSLQQVHNNLPLENYKLSKHLKFSEFHSYYGSDYPIRQHSNPCFSLHQNETEYRIPCSTFHPNYSCKKRNRQIPAKLHPWSSQPFYCNNNQTPKKSDYSKIPYPYRHSIYSLSPISNLYFPMPSNRLQNRQYTNDQTSDKPFWHCKTENSLYRFARKKHEISCDWSPYSHSRKHSYANWHPLQTTRMEPIFDPNQTQMNHQNAQTRLPDKYHSKYNSLKAKNRPTD